VAAVNPKALNYEGDHIDEADFTAGKDDGDQLQAGVVGEIATAEVGEDGKLSSYEAVRPGDRTDGNDPTRGRIFVALEDGNGNVVSDKVQWRLAVRDKNNNRRIPVTSWYRQRDSNNQRPDHRVALRPVTRGGKPFFIKDGRVLVLEVKNESSTVTVSASDSTVEVPARLGN